jgi:hypothetical protein
MTPVAMARNSPPRVPPDCERLILGRSDPASEITLVLDGFEDLNLAAQAGNP